MELCRKPLVTVTTRIFLPASAAVKGHARKGITRARKRIRRESLDFFIMIESFEERSCLAGIGLGSRQKNCTLEAKDRNSCHGAMSNRWRFFDQSDFNATSGSVFVARRAGI